MNKVNKKGIDKLIFRTFLEIFMISLFVALSYLVFSSNNLAGSAKIAEAYSTGDYDFQSSYERTSDNMCDIMTFSNLLDKGELVVRNPNKKKKQVKVVMIIEDGVNVNFDELEIKVNDVPVDLSKKTLNGNNYEIELENTSIEAYENYKGVISFYGNPTLNNNFNYSFHITKNL